MASLSRLLKLPKLLQVGFVQGQEFLILGSGGGGHCFGVGVQRFGVGVQGFGVGAQRFGVGVKAWVFGTIDAGMTPSLALRLRAKFAFSAF